MLNLLAVASLSQPAQKRTAALARLWQLPLIDELTPAEQEHLTALVEVDMDRISLRKPHWPERARMTLDFTSGTLGYRQARHDSQGELLARATQAHSARGLTLVDATAGFGADSAMLAALGFKVIALERHPVLFTMLSEALQEGSQQVPGLQRIQPLCRDACDWLCDIGAEGIDLVYLDPMFPERGKSAEVKKPMQILQAMLAHEEGEEVNLLDLALQVARYRVVVKRPLRAPIIEGPVPTTQVMGKSIRFDVYARRSMRSINQLIE